MPSLPHHALSPAIVARLFCRMDALLVRLIVLLPLAGAILTGLVPLFMPGLRRNESLISTIGTLAVAVPLGVVVYLFLTFDGTAFVATFYTWMAAGDLSVDFAYRIDQLSLIMGLVVLGVGTLIHVYSIGYMHGDDGFWKFFSFLNLFIFAMLNLVLADNLVVLFLGWEGVGLCSYLLIGFWYTDLKNSAAANKAFIVNRIGDVAFLLAMFLLFQELGGLDFDTLLTGVDALSGTTVTMAVLLFFLAATGKSAQIPLFVWLPDAMAGPTPVSALIHAATMVTSGLYLLARMSEMVLAAPGVMTLIAIVGALTALVAATIAITQTDIKRVLAYSTVSQLGFMFMAAGVGAFFVAIFHVVTHAFFKALLFLGSGSVIHGMHEVEHDLDHAGHDVSSFDAQDMRTMGNLKAYMPATHITFLIATLAIAGIPLLSGFFSKDEILFMAFQAGYNGAPAAYAVWAVGIFTALLTAVYMTRAYVLTFRGEERWPEAPSIKPHESPLSMTLPLWTLAILAIVGGYIGLPGVIADGDWNWIHHYLGQKYGGPVADLADSAGYAVPLGLKWVLVGLGGGVALLGVSLAWIAYDREGLAFDERLRDRLGSLYDVWEVKYRLDEVYDAALVNPIRDIMGQGFAKADASVVDGLVNGVARGAAAFGRMLGRIQTGVVQRYAVMMVLGAVIVMALILFV